MTKLLRKKPVKAGGKKVTPVVRHAQGVRSVVGVRQQLNVLNADGRFDEVLALIEAARRRAYQAVNTELVNLYWQLGEYIGKKLAAAEWGASVVDELATTIARRYPGMRGYTRSNLFRMRQFYEAYCGAKKVAPLVRQLPWTHHLIILGQTRHPEEREFYILAAIKGRWTKRELDRQIRTGAALRGAAGARNGQGRNIEERLSCFYEVGPRPRLNGHTRRPDAFLRQNNSLTAKEYDSACPAMILDQQCDGEKSLKQVLGSPPVCAAHHQDGSIRFKPFLRSGLGRFEVSAPSGV